MTLGNEREAFISAKFLLYRTWLSMPVSQQSEHIEEDWPIIEALVKDTDVQARLDSALRHEKTMVRKEKK